jgi:adenosylcobinamide-GDP ribazoletransferase
VLLGADAAGLSPLVAATLAVAALAVATRGLHLDGLADLADGLGTGRSAPDALAVMKQPDIGPFGVVTVALTLALQVGGARGARVGRRRILGCPDRGDDGPARRHVGLPTRSARRPADGLGAHVAGSLAPLAVAACRLCGDGRGRGARAARRHRGVARGHGRRCRRAGCAGPGAACGPPARGITGDVLGALVETATTVSLVVLATG